jgi:hypothetical protein
MELNKEQQDMLDGKYGEGTALAMKIQVAIGEAYNAPYMVSVTRTHVALSNQEADLWFAEKLVEKGAVCRVAPTVNPGFHIEFFKDKYCLADEDESIMQRTRNAYRKLGATLTYNCTPYMEKNIPKFGEVISFSESSATPYVNSVYGARTNRESAQSALCAVVTGYVPYYGYLLDENRKGEVLVKVEADMSDNFKYRLLGYLVPEIIGFKIPVFTGIENPSPEALRNLGAELNTGGNVAIYHIVGFTPEADTVEQAFGGREPEKTIVITDEDLKKMNDKLSDEGGKIDFALFGCPHFSIEDVKRVVEAIDGRKLKVPLFIMCSALTKNLAVKMGLLDKLKEAGGDIAEDTCMDQPCWKFLYGKKGVTDSPKCAYYTKRRQMEFVITDIKSCVEASVKGEI